MSDQNLVDCMSGHLANLHILKKIECISNEKRYLFIVKSIVLLIQTTSCFRFKMA